MINSNDINGVLEEFLEFERNTSAQNNLGGLSIKKAQIHLPPWTNKVKQLLPPFTYFAESERRCAKFGDDSARTLKTLLTLYQVV